MSTRRLLVLVALGAAACARTPAEPEITDLPGAPPFAAEVRTRLAAAVAARPAGEPPRTRHRRPDGTPRWTNRLILEPSPYLQQHAHNPVDWQAWGEEAFARARREAKPILLSVGYSTCHWCHVMEEESFEDEEIAAYLNQHYVAVKVDREVRPDVDEVYMTAVQMLTGRGGWPMTVWLTPGLQPFYGGTYFPARDGDRGIRTGFLTLLRALREAFEESPTRVAAQADELTLRLRAAAAPAPGQVPAASALQDGVARWRASFDAEFGGFGRAPKFPTPPVLDLLLRYHRRTGDPQALRMVTVTLERMAAGGIRDHVGGGFHRYATDRAWLVPHFEKMLPDNAQLARTYLAASLVTGRADFGAVTREILDYLTRDMLAPEGAFFAATDADSEGAEGRFFTWTPDEIRVVLDAPAARAVLAVHGVTAAGNFEGRNILHLPRPLDAVARDLDLSPEALTTLLAAAHGRLRAARARRVPPHRDTKILAGWNGLAISAFARAGATLGEPAYLDRARTAAAFVLDRLRPDGRLHRVWAAGAAHEEAFLEDHALLAEGLVDLHDATGEARWLVEATALHETLRHEFADDEAGGFFQTGRQRPVTLARQKPDHDGALPSGNAVAALTLLRLAELTGDDGWRGDADATLRAFGEPLAAQPTGAAGLLAALDFRLDRPKEIVVVAPPGTPESAAALAAVVRRTYLPNAVVSIVTEGPAQDRLAALVPLVADKVALRGVATAYVCEARVCSLPTSDPAVLAAQLARVEPLPEDGRGGAP